MANNSFCNLSDKGYAFTGGKEDIIATELQHFRIALQIIAGHPKVLDEYRRAVLGPAKDPPEKPTTPENPRIGQGQHL